MKITSILSLSLAATGAALAAPAGQDPAAPKAADRFTMRATSLGREILFKDRPIVALSESTIETFHLPPSFGLENFTIHPASKPVTFTLEPLEGENTFHLVGEQNEGDKSATPYVTQYIYLNKSGPNTNAMGYTYSADGQQGCPKGAHCINTWVVLSLELPGLHGEPRTLRVLGPNMEHGQWEAVKTEEGNGWRVVWREGVFDIDTMLWVTLHNEADTDY